jgi:outer membrane protein
MLLLGGPAAGGETPDPEAPYTLIECYALALQQSEVLGIREAEWQSAEARYRRAMGARGPEIQAIGLAQWQDEGDSDRRNDEEYHAGARATVPIFTGFRLLREAQARRAEGEAFRLVLERSRQMLYEDVADVFYQALSLERQREVLDQLLAALQERVEELDRRVALGRSRRADLLSAQAQRADTRVTIERILGQRDAALELLAFLTGRPAASLRLEETGALPIPGEVTRYLAHAENRYDIQAAEAFAEARRRDVAAARGERNVQVDLGGAYYVWSDPDDSGDWDVTLRAELPLFDRGGRRAQVAERAGQARASELRLAEVRRSAGRDVRQAYREVISALAQWSALQEALQLTRENYETQRRDYELGRASNLDALVALAQWHNQKREEAVLEMLARAALVHLHVAAGESAP